MRKLKMVHSQVSFVNYWTPEVKRTVILVFLSTAVTSFLVHGFLFSNEMFSHDSLGYGYFFDAGTVSYYTGLGRFFIPVYERIKGAATVPWTIGILFTLWITLTAWLLVRLLKIRTTGGIVLTSALVCANLAMSLTGASYIYCMDEYAFALFAAVGAAYLFAKGGWFTLPGLAGLVISAGVYQAYFITAACVCLLVVVGDLIENKRCRLAFLRGIRFLVLLAFGFVLYYATWYGLCICRGTVMARTNESVLSSGFGGLFGLVLEAAMTYIRAMLCDHGILNGLMTVVHIAVLLLLALWLLRLLSDQELHIANKILLVILVMMMPVAFNAAQILFPTSATRLTNFTWEMPYLLLLLSVERDVRKSWKGTIRTVAVVLLCSVLWHHTLYANHVYLKKDLEKNATITLAARMIDRIELLDGYIPGETRVAFVGMLLQNPSLNRIRPEFVDFTDVGLWGQYAATYSMGAYLTTYLNYPLVVDTVTDYSQMVEVQQMPCFPAADSVQMINGTVVVKLA